MITEDLECEDNEESWWILDSRELQRTVEQARKKQQYFSQKRGVEERWRTKDSMKTVVCWNDLMKSFRFIFS